eukprot:Nitzschia sp. Nitz4//scaffold183_size43938//26709//27473//NITZ4_007271-RA/size43938-processed-gene-0.6-mRNA-1//1//CDS//3329539617//7437//frame0
MLARQCQRQVAKRLVAQQIRTLSSSAGDASGSKGKTMADQKRALARAALQKVPQYGWTQDAVTAAVLENKLSLSMSGMLTPAELVHWLMDDFNQQLKEDPEKKDWSVFQKIQWRLEQVIPLAQNAQWHKGMAMGLSTPFTTREQLHEFVELVAPAGSSTMYKTGLGGVFVASELHLLADSSPEYQDTWAFLQTRLDELERGQFVNFLGDKSASLPLVATTAVASSLMEGLASLVLPASVMKAPGTNPSDYVPKK